MAKKKADKTPESAAQPAKPPPPSWRAGLDFIVMLGGAVLVALLIKAFVFDVYLIPSGSMETALHGRPDGGDRIFCSKINYHFRRPDRWEVAVFEFPYESARRTDIYNVSEQYRGQNFVKRVVGLPGETLAIARGDIWVRPNAGTGEYERVVKPDSVQRGMWLNVYEETFADLDKNDLSLFWKIGKGVELERGGPLRLVPGAEPALLEYRPLVPGGPAKSAMLEMPGIPDRYTLQQPVQFRCATTLASGETCGHVFVKTFKTQNMQARCPRCGAMQDETSAIFYHRRSGLAAVGRYAVDPAHAAQGEEAPPRTVDYHIVPDLRVVADIALAGEASRFSVFLKEDDRFVRLDVNGDGRLEILINGQPSKATDRALAEITPGKTHRLEFYIADGTARVFVDSTEKTVLDLPVWKDKRPFPRDLAKSSGVRLRADGGEVRVHSLAIDRDVYYYSGWEQEKGERFAQMNSQGEVFINDESFFPMGDHCPSSFDARSWGPVPLALLRGPALFIWWPPNRISAIPSP